MQQAIPRIDLTHFTKGDPQQKQQFVENLGEGLRRTGFLIIRNHGIDQSLTTQTYDCFKDFFNLDEATKKNYDVVIGGQRGYTPFGVEHALDAPTPDLKEFWHVGQELPEDHPYRKDYPDNVWPDECPQLRVMALQLYNEYENCARKLLEALALYFKLPLATFADMMTCGDSIMRVIHYPPLAEDTPANAVRAAAHEDINLITLLTQSQGQGLQILTNEGDWVAVHALDGDIIVDSGDMLSRVTNGVIPATTHRVVNPGKAENCSRYSMPFFAHPFAACDLSVIPKFVSQDNPAKWEPITARRFLAQRLEDIGLLAG